MFKLRLALLASTAFIGISHAQPACSIVDVTYALRTSGIKTVSLGFLPGLKAPSADIQKAHPTWTVIDLSTNAFASVPRSEIVAPSGFGPSAAELTPDFELDAKHSYLLTVRGIPGCTVDEPLSAKITIITSGPTPGPIGSSVNKATGHYIVLTPSKTRTDSDIFISGLINGATHQKAAYTADVKVQLSYIVKTARPASGWSPELSIVPNFDFTASTSRGSDGNSVSIGSFLRVSSSASERFWLFKPVFEPGFALQADKYFRATTPLFRLPIYFTPPVGNLGNMQFYAQPLMGVEAGTYSSLPGPKEYATAPAVLPSPDTVLRPFAGMSAYYFVYTGQRPLFSLQGDFIRRWPVFGEPNYSQDSNSKLTLINVGRNPRDYLILKAQRDLTQYFGFTFQFDYGRLPPLYTLVDHKYSLAITFKAGLKSGVR